MGQYMSDRVGQGSAEPTDARLQTQRKTSQETNNLERLHLKNNNKNPWTAEAERHKRRTSDKGNANEIGQLDVEVNGQTFHNTY